MLMKRKNKKWKEPELKEVYGLEKSILVLEMEETGQPINPLIELMQSNSCIKIGEIAIKKIIIN